MYKISIAILFALLLPAHVSAAGSPIQKMSLPGLVRDGDEVQQKTFDLSEIVGKRPVVFLYWMPSVPGALQELSRIKTLAAESSADGIRFLTVSRALDDHEEQRIRDVIAAEKLDLPVLLDRNLDVARNFGASFLPAYLGFDKAGRIRFQNFHSLTDEVRGGGTLAAKLAGGKVPDIAPREPKQLRPGDKAPDFELRDLRGREVDLRRALGGRPVLLIFWSPTCPHCQRELPRIAAFLRDNPKAYRTLSIARINGDEEKQLASAFKKRHALPFPVLLDGGAVMHQYAIPGVPTWLVINEEGRVVTVRSGQQSRLELLLKRFAR